MDIVAPKVEDYLRGLFATDGHPVAEEMERVAEERDFPIVGPLVGRMLELFARSVGARRILELGSGYGYSAYWFARAVEPGGEVHMTEGDPENQREALAYLERAGLADRVHSHVGDAIELMDRLEGEFDVIFCDIDKPAYPDAWRKARERLRPGGLYLCDNVLWSGRVADEGPAEGDGGVTDAIREHNALVAADADYDTTIVPLRDGVMVARRRLPR
ncbi:MAG TPA: O-methyltransferase [Actinomycetota bacterium]|nr:O-methyltransferase [Actinomycetota bacterium]